MSPFLVEYTEQVNIPICTGVIVLTLDSGEVVILEFRQGWWFLNRMEKSLINSNECQEFVIQICDDPTDPYRKFVID